MGGAAGRSWLDVLSPQVRHLSVLPHQVIQRAAQPGAAEG